MEYIVYKQSVRSLFMNALVFGVFVCVGSFLAPHAVYAAAPTFTASTVTADTNTDGTIDRITLFFSEATDLDDTGGTADGFSSITFTDGCTIANGDYTGDGVLSMAFSVAGCTQEDTSITPTATYTSVASCATNFSLCDDAEANQAANSTSRVAVDGAGPVLLASIPLHFHTDVSGTASIILTFSEPIVSFADAVSPSVGTSDTSSGNVVTVRPAGRFIAGYTTYTVVTASDAATNTFAGAQAGNSTVANPLIFRVAASSSTDETSGEVTTSYSVNFLTPSAGDSFSPGEAVDVTWENGEGRASYVNLSYSEDGETWQTIATNILNDSSYAWTVPDINADSVTLKITTTDLVVELASDTSSSFSVLSSAENEDSSSDVSGEVLTEIDGIHAGDYIKGTSFDAVYYVDAQLMRRPFFNEQTYFTYEDSFDGVVEVSDSTLAKFVMGAPMLPKAGIVLVKIQSVAKVYLVEEDESGHEVLRWITSEDIAKEMFGSDWSSYIVDVDVTSFSRYEQGEDVESAYEVDTEIMKHTTELHD